MLNFWYSERCTRPIKLSIIITTCVIILITSKQLQLSPILTGLSLALGILLHFIRMWSIKMKSQHSFKKAFHMLSLGIPILGMLLLILGLPTTDLIVFWALLGQLLGFVLIGFFLVSTVEHRAKRRA